MRLNLLCNSCPPEVTVLGISQQAPQLWGVPVVSACSEGSNLSRAQAQVCDNITLPRLPAQSLQVASASPTPTPKGSYESGTPINSSNRLNYLRSAYGIFLCQQPGKLILFLCRVHGIQWGVEYCYQCESRGGSKNSGDYGMYFGELLRESCCEWCAIDTSAFISSAK